MDQKFSEMQERLDKIGTARPFVPPAQDVDYSEMQARLNKVGTSYRSFVAPVEVIDRSEMQARLNNAAPVAKTVSIPTPKVITQELPVAKSIPAPAIEIPAIPEALPKRPAKSSLSIVPPVPVERPYQPIESELTSTYSTAPDAFEAPELAFRSPSTAPQSKGRSSWILWLGIALFVAIVIAQLIWVMS